jgi:hypothetical protein
MDRDHAVLLAILFVHQKTKEGSVMRMRKFVVSLLLLICSAPAFAGSYYTCTNPETGSKMFSRTPCGVDAEKRRETRANTANLDSDRDRYTALKAEEERKKAVLEQRRNAAIERRKQQEQPVVSTVPKGMEKACAELERRSNRMADMSSRQLERLAWCRGGPKPEPLRTPPPPSVITNCDAGGCWDNRGRRYNHGGGPTHIRQDGRVCQNIGGMMQCN